MTDVRLDTQQASATSNKRTMPPQVAFLDELCAGQTGVAIYLISGTRLQGTIAAFDSHTVLLSGEFAAQLIQKTAISTVMPSTSKR